MRLLQMLGAALLLLLGAEVRDPYVEEDDR